MGVVRDFTGQVVILVSTYCLIPEGNRDELQAVEVSKKVKLCITFIWPFELLVTPRHGTKTPGPSQRRDPSHGRKSMIQGHPAHLLYLGRERGLS